MSYSEQTPYLGLPIRSASDTFNTMDNNDAFRTTDTKVKQAVDDSAQAKEDATEAKSNASEAVNAVGELEGTVEAQGGALDEHAERLVILSNRVTAQGAQIALKANASSIAPLYDDEAGTYEVDDVVMHLGQLYKCNTQITVPESFDVNKWDVTDVESLIGGSGGTVPASNVSYIDTLTQLGANNVQDAIVALKTLIDSMGGGGMKPLDMSNKIAISTTTETPDTDGVVFGYFRQGTGSCKLTIDGVDIAEATANVDVTNLYFPVAEGQAIALTNNYAAGAVYFAPYL